MAKNQSQKVVVPKLANVLTRVKLRMMTMMDGDKFANGGLGWQTIPPEVLICGRAILIGRIPWIDVVCHCGWHK